MHDVCIIGHVTRDVVHIEGRPSLPMPGGSAYYCALTLARLGRSVRVITRVAAEDAPILDALTAAGVQVDNLGSPTTHVFENSYFGPQLTERTQRVTSVAQPFRAEDLDTVAARSIILGPLLCGDVDPEVFEAAASIATQVASDAQGNLRYLDGDQVSLRGWPDATSLLQRLTILKADDREAAHIVGDSSPADAAAALERLGVPEVLITLADRGSHVRSAGVGADIPALPPRRVVEATGCGDTFLAAYLHRRLDGANPQMAARFAAATASLKLESSGPFDATEAAVNKRLGEVAEPDPPV